MIAIIDRNLNATDRIQPEKMPLNLEERKSTASFDIDLDAPEISFGAWLRDETEPGKGIIWRVKSGGKQFDKKTKTIQLEHIINTLKDVLMFGEIGPKQITGNSKATVCTAKQAAQKVLSYQSIWTLGDFEYDVSNPYNFNGDNLYSALETITSSLDGAYWDYDLTKLPFKLHIRKLPTGVACEMRESRNIQTLRKTVDGSRMFTRFYPVGKNNLHITGDYVSKNENIYGTISKTETDQSMDTKEKLLAWANERIKNHCEPSVTVQISGFDWSEATGEPLDKLALNKKCRVPVPEYSTVIEEKITKLSWQDKIHEPEKVTVTLANLIEDVASIINQQNKSGSKGKKTHAKQGEEDHAWMVDTTTHIGLVAEAVAGEGADKDWSRVASVMVDGEGIHQRVTKTEGGIITLETAYEQQEDSIGMVIKKSDSRPVKRVLKKKDLPAAGDASKLYFVVEENRYYEWKNGKYSVATNPTKTIDAASIVLSINDAGETEAHIDANKVYIGNQKSTTVINGKITLSDVTADFISGRIATLSLLKVNNLQAIGTIYASGNITTGGDVMVPSGVGTVSLLNAYNALQVVPAGNNTYKIQRKSFNNSEWQDVPGTFSRATSLSGTWSGKKLTVTATPQGNTYQSEITTGFVTGTASDPPVGYFITAYHADQGAQSPSEIRSARLQIQLGVLENSKNVIRVLNAAGTSFINGSPMLTIPTLVAENIKQGVDILGIIGTYGGPSPSYEAPYGTPIGSTIVTSGNIVSNGVSSAFSLARETMRPQGSTVDIQAVKLTLGSDVIGRIDVPLEECTVDGVGPFTPSAGKVGFSQVTVDTTNLTPSNIRSGKTILGVTGTYAPSYETPYGTAIGSIIKKTGDVTANGKSAQFTLANETIRPQGASADIKAVKLTLGNNVIGRIDVSNATPTVTGVEITDDQNDHNPGYVNIGGTGVASTTQPLMITNGSWSSGRMAVNIRLNNSSGTLIARKWMIMPTPTESCTNPAAFNFRITATVGGKSVTYLLKTNANGSKVSFAKV